MVEGGGRLNGNKHLRLGQSRRPLKSSTSAILQHKKEKKKINRNVIGGLHVLGQIESVKILIVLQIFDSLNLISGED
jgi:hypothetical protein